MHHAESMDDLVTQNALLFIQFLWPIHLPEHNLAHRTIHIFEAQLPKPNKKQKTTMTKIPREVPDKSTTIPGPQSQRKSVTVPADGFVEVTLRFDTGMR